MPIAEIHALTTPMTTPIVPPVLRPEWLLDEEDEDEVGEEVPGS
jgi:hypothetical protein